MGRLVRDRARGIDPRPLEVSSERISISHEETFPQDVGDPERLHDELDRMAERLARAPPRSRPDRAHGHDEAALSRLRDPHPLDLARRSAPTTRGGSASSRAACSTGRSRDRPGPLRLVGVGVSGLAEHAQLELSLGALMERGDWTAIAHADIDLMNPLPVAKLDEVLDVLELEPGARVLDLGCGKGELLRRLAARYAIEGTASTAPPRSSTKRGAARRTA